MSKHSRQTGANDETLKHSAERCRNVVGAIAGGKT
jgi:hypothetical protein